MTKFEDGFNNITSYDEVRYNDQNRAFRNSITTSGQAINNSDNEQVAKAMANYSSVSTFYTDSGIADSYILTPIDFFKGITALIDGAEVRFRAGNPNTGASTINVNGLGAVAIKQSDGVTDLIEDDITTLSDTVLRYDVINSVWTLVTVARERGSLENVTSVIASGIITVRNFPLIGVYRVDTEGAAASDDLDTINGGNSGQIFIFRSATQTRDITYKDNVGNLRLTGGDFTTVDVSDTITLLKDGGNMYELSRAPNNPS